MIQMIEKIKTLLGSDDKEKKYFCHICTAEFEAKSKPERCPSCGTDTWNYPKITWKGQTVFVKDAETKMPPNQDKR